jgi:RNA polymerase sigma-70 factor (ECF subfamily)
MKQPVDDSQLLAALAEGDLEAPGDLYDAYARRVWHVLLARGLQSEEAEDILQDVFLSLLDRGRAVQHIGNVQAYLITVGRNMAGRYMGRARGHNGQRASCVIEGRKVTKSVG